MNPPKACNQRVHFIFLWLFSILSFVCFSSDGFAQIGENILVNGSFEANQWNGSRHQEPEGWVLGGVPKRGGLHRNRSRATDGDQYIPLGGWSSGFGMSLSQDVTLVPGGIYQLQFDNRVSRGRRSFSILVELITDNSTTVFEESITISPAEGLVTSDFRFTAQSNQATLRFTHTGGGGRDLDFDNVKLSLVDSNPHPGPDNIVINGSFEDNQWNGNRHQQPDGWILGGVPESGGLHRSPSRASNGDQYVVMGGWSGRPGLTLSQEVAVVDNEFYLLEFDTVINFGTGAATLLAEVEDAQGTVVEQTFTIEKADGLVTSQVRFIAPSDQVTIRFTLTSGTLNLDFDYVRLSIDVPGFYIDGQLTTLDLDGNGIWNEVYYIAGQATTLDLTGTGFWQAVYYINGQPTQLDETGTGTDAGVYFIDGLATTLDADGSGLWNGAYFIDGQPTTLDTNGTGAYNNIYYLNGSPTTLDLNGTGSFKGVEYLSGHPVEALTGYDFTASAAAAITAEYVGASTLLGAGGFANANRSNTVGETTGLAASGTAFGATSLASFGDANDGILGNNLAQSIAANDYLSFTINGDSSESLNVARFSVSTALEGVNAAVNYNVLAQVNGRNTWVASDALTTDQVSSINQNTATWHPTLIDLSNDPRFQGIDSVEFRIYFWGASGAVAGSRINIDNLLVEGSVGVPVVTASATSRHWVPDPLANLRAEAAIAAVNTNAPGQWFRVDFTQTFTTAPVVVTGPGSHHGVEHPSILVRNITTTGFEFSIPEAEVLDSESISFFALEPGQHSVAGQVWQAGFTDRVNAEPASETYPGALVTTPVVLAQPTDITAASPQVVRTRISGVDSRGFQLQIEALSSQTIFPAKVGWIAIETGEAQVANGNLTAETVVVPALTPEQWSNIAFNQVEGAFPLAFISQQTTNDHAAQSIHTSNLSAAGIGLLRHSPSGSTTAEDVGLIRLGNNRTTTETDARIELGEVDVDSMIPGQWVMVDTAVHRQNPVMILGLPNLGSDQPALFRVRNITAVSFEIQLSDLDGASAALPRTLPYLLMEEGIYNIGGQVWEAGRNYINSSEWRGIELHNNHTQAPVLVGNVTSNRDPSAIVPRFREVTNEGFEARLIKPLAGEHLGEALHYLAISSGTGVFGNNQVSFETYSLTDVGTNYAAANLANDQSGGLAFGAIQTANTENTALLSGRDNAGFEFNVSAGSLENVAGVVFFTSVDSDGDGIPDADEIAAGLDPNNPDSDGDGIADLNEYLAAQVEPGIDSDGDGVSDQVEHLLGRNPNGDEFTESERITSRFETGLKVFTPIAQ